MKELSNEIEIDVYGLLTIDKKLDENLVSRYIDGYSEIISMNELIDIEFIRKWKEKLDWKTLSVNFQFTENEILEFFGSIHWKSAIYCQKSCTNKFIEENDLSWVIDSLQKVNFDFMTKSNSQYGQIENLLIISEENREIILEVLLARIVSNLGGKNKLELLFENGDLYLIQNDVLINMVREIKIDMLENIDIIEIVRNTANSFGENINKKPG